MSNKRCPKEFKIEAVKHITEGGYSVSDVSNRLGVTTHSLYAWVKKYGPEKYVQQAKADEQAKLKHLRLKKGVGILCQGVQLSYAFIKDNQANTRVRRFCR